jgi:hypothetical protein
MTAASIQQEIGAPKRSDLEGCGLEGLDLEGLDLEGLRAVWRERYGRPPKLRSVELLRLTLAWRLQAEAIGGLDRDTRRKLGRNGPVQAEGLELGAGTILRRDWQGRMIEVVVEADGFRWDGKLFASLSAVATAIAGTRWNGPRFFGLRQTGLQEAGLRQTGPEPQSGQAGLPRSAQQRPVRPRSKQQPSSTAR